MMEIKLTTLYIWTAIKLIMDCGFLIFCKWHTIVHFVISVLKKTL